MSLFNRFVLPVITLCGFAFLVACGGGTNNNVPPPSGGFSNSDFKGNYTFSISGEDGNGALSIAGTVTACGCTAGTISGTVDITDIAGTGAGIAITSSGSGYTVNANGIGTMLLNIPSSSGNVPFKFAFVLTDAAHGSIMEYDTNGSGSGTIDLQPSSVTLATTPYAFSLSGSDASGNSLSLVGNLTLNSSGSISTGIVDLNDNAAASADLALSGSMTAGTGTTPGSAALTFSSSQTLHFDVYSIDATHLKLVGTDAPSEVLIGDVYSQSSTTIPSGTLSFSMAGEIPSSSAATVYALAGTVASDGSSQLSSGSEDINANGTVDGGGTTPYSFSGTFVASPSGSGRFQVALSGFQGGVNFVAYPSSGGVLLLEMEPSGTINAGTSGGVAMAQSSPGGLTASQGYGLNLTGFDISNGTELDQVAQFNTTSSNVSGAIYQNDFGVINPTSYNVSSNSTYTSGATGEIVLNFNSGSEGTLYYGVTSSNAFALGVDSTDVSLGVVEQQGSPSSTSDAARRQLAMARAARAKALKQKKQ